MEVAVLLANPASSQFTGGLHRQVVRGLSRHYAVEAVWPLDPAHTRHLASDAARRGAALVVAMGGDGVVHHAAQGLAGSSTPLGIVPVGTTNVVARLVGVPLRPGAAVKALTSRPALLRSPVLHVEAEGDRGRISRLAVFALGVGADAVVVEKAEAEPFRKYRFGSLHYARTAVSTVWSELRRRSPSAWVEADGRRAPALGLMVQLLSAYTYFGRLPLRLSSSPPDPMTILVISRLRMRRTPSILRGALTRRGLGGVRGFEVWEGAREVTVSSPEPLTAQADGEPLGAVTRLTATVRPGALRLLVPAQAPPR